MEKSFIDNNSHHDILTPREVAQWLRKDLSWVYRHKTELGGVKLGGCLFFPGKEQLYDSLFQKGKRVEIPLHPAQKEVCQQFLSDQSRSQKGRGRKKGGDKAGNNPDRHGLLRVIKQKT